MFISFQSATLTYLLKIIPKTLFFMEMHQLFAEFYAEKAANPLNNVAWRLHEIFISIDVNVWAFAFGQHDAGLNDPTIDSDLEILVAPRERGGDVAPIPNWNDETSRTRQFRSD